MKQKQLHILENVEQLRAFSDPLRVQMMVHLVEKAYTGQQLSKMLNTPRSKIHYHLKELEKAGLIFIEKREEKNGILQKFYKAIARGFVPSDELLPYAREKSEIYRKTTLSVLERARSRVLSAPEEAFEMPSSQVEDNPFLCVQAEFKMSEKKFNSFKQKIMELLNELGLEDESPDDRYYYITSIGFQIDERWFEEDHSDSK